MLSPAQNEMERRRICLRLNRKTPLFDNINDMLYEISNLLSKKFEQNTSIKMFECGTYNIETLTFYNRTLSKIEILFDNFLSDVLLQFDIFYFINAKAIDYTKYWYKTLSDIQFGKAKYGNCILTIQRYRELQYSFSELGEYPIEIRSKAINAISIQHWFIIFHEIGHILFNYNMINPTLIKNVEMRLIDIIKKSFGDDKNDCNKMTKFIHQNVRLIEECVCDSFACSMAFETYKVNKNYSLDEIAESIYLAAQNMKILSLAFDCADLINTSKTSVYSAIRDAFIGNWIPIIYTSIYYGIGLDDENLSEKATSPICEKITAKINTISQFYISNASFERFQELIKNYLDIDGAISLDSTFSNEMIAVLESTIEMLI